MSDAIRTLHDYLAKSPSVVYPQDVLEFLPAIEAENAKLRELVLHMYTCMGNVDADGNHECFSCEYEGSECDYGCRMRELGVEV